MDTERRSPDLDRGPPFDRQLISTEGFTLLSFKGELDLANEPLAAAALEEVIEAEATSVVVVDLTNLTFMDCSGLRVLIGARNTLEARGIELRIRVPASGVVRRVFEVLNDRLELEQEVA